MRNPSSDSETRAAHADRLTSVAGRAGFLVVAIGIATVFITFALEAAIGLGGNIPTVFLERDYLVGVLWGAALTISVFWWPVSLEERKVLLALWALRLATTLIAMLLYEQQYDFLDSYSYFTDSREIALNGFVSDAPFNTRNVTNTFSLLWYVLPPSYHALKVTCAYIGLIAALIFYRSWRVAGGDSIWGLWIIGATPSVLFWSSIVGKDPLIFLAIGIATWGTLKLWRGGDALAFCSLVAGMAMMFFVRPWMVPIFGLAVATAFVVSSRHLYVKVLAAVVGVIVIAIAVYFVRVVVGIDQDARLISAIGIVSSAWAVGGSATEAVAFDSLSDIISFLPLGVFTAFFRPLPGEIGGIFGLFAGCENALLLILVIWSAVRLARAKWQFPVIFALAILVWWSGLYAFLSYQNLGTAVRFKLQVMPFLLALIGFAFAASSRVAPRAPTRAS